MTSQNKWYVTYGIINKEFYENFIKDKVTKNLQKKFEELLEDEDDDFIEYFRVAVENPEDRAWEYSTLWFFDLNLEKGYLPVYIAGVNSKSIFAMSCCGMDRDDDDEESEHNTFTLEKLLEYAPDIKWAKTIKKLLTL